MCNEKLVRGEHIYKDIAEKIKIAIAKGEFKENEKIPSQKELASLYGVSISTLKHATDILIESKILQNKRGLGIFVAAGAKQIIIDEKIERLEETINEILEEAQLLGIKKEEIIEQIKFR